MNLNIGDLKLMLNEIEDNKEISIYFDLDCKNVSPCFRFENENGQITLKIKGKFNKLLDISEDVLDNLIIGSYLPF